MPYFQQLKKIFATSNINEENFNEYEKKALCFINKIDKFPNANIDRNWSKNFGNGVAISFSNHPRDTYADLMYPSFIKNERPDIFYIEKIVSTQRGKGYATEALKKVMQIADECGVTLRLYPKEIKKEQPQKLQPKNLTTKQLTKWYERHKFHRLPKEENKDSLYLERPIQSISDFEDE